jgi:hypothetical protein
MDWKDIKDWAVPIGTAAIGALATLASLWFKRATEREGRDVQQQDIAVKQSTAQLSFDATQAQTLTERFRALMDGYEHRIDDLTGDLRDHKQRMATLERQFATHKAICGDCDRYAKYVRENPDAASAA